jgi:hypothetical protein
MKSLEMSREIKLEILWGGEGVFMVRFSAWNGEFAGSTDLLVERSVLSELAQALHGFPENPSDRRTIPLAAVASEQTRGDVVLQFFCRDGAGHAVVTAEIKSQADETSIMQSVCLSGVTEASAIDAFVVGLRGMESWRNSNATLAINHREPVDAVGRRGAYHWLSSRSHSLDDLLRRFPEAILGCYIAVTSFDSGPLVISEKQRIAGWTFRDGIAYSPLIQDASTIPHDGYDEWYAFSKPVDLGQLASREQNIFESELALEAVFPLVNYGGFAVHRTQAKELVEIFWKQIDRIRPSLYIADGDYLTIACDDKELFSEIVQALGSSG